MQAPFDARGLAMPEAKRVNANHRSANASSSWVSNLEIDAPLIRVLERARRSHVSRVSHVKAA